MRLNLSFCYSHSQKAEQLKAEEIKTSGARDSGQTLHFGSNLAWTSPPPASWFHYQSVCNWRRMRSFCNIPTWPKNSEMLQLGSAEFHKDIEKLSEEAQLIWNLSKFGCVVNVFGSFLGDWNKHRCKTVRAELAFRSVEKVGQFVIWCVCFWKTAHRSVKTKNCSHWNYYAKACSANWGFFYEVIVGSVSK